MYWSYLLKRVANGIIIYIILMFVFALIFDTTMLTTVKQQIEEEINGMVMKINVPMSPEDLETYINSKRDELYHRYHLDQSSTSRIIYRTWDSITFNFGKSTLLKSKSGSRKVWDIVSERIPLTLLLFGVAMVIDVIFGIWLGIKKAQKAGKSLDKVTSIGTMVVYGMPRWWLGMLMMMFFAYNFKIFPSGGIRSVPPPDGFAGFIDLIYHLLLPVITLVIIGFWGRAFITRNIVLGTLQEDFVMSARARGIPERKVLYGHTMRTAAPPIVTMALLAMLVSISGSILFEGIFSWPGMGSLYWSAVQTNDIPVLMGNLAVTTGLYIIGLVILDLIYGILDPRIKVGGKA